jgi:hypothetical protein
MIEGLLSAIGGGVAVFPAASNGGRPETAIQPICAT